MSNATREQIILRAYYRDDEALRRFHGLLKPEHFKEDGAPMLFEVLRNYRNEYNRVPSHEEMVIEIRDYHGPKQCEEDAALGLLNNIMSEQAPPDPRWLERQAVKFIDEAETVAVVMDFIEAEGKHKEDTEVTSSDLLLRQVSRVYDMRETLTSTPLAGLAFGAVDYVWDKFNSAQQRFPWDCRRSTS